MSTLESFVQIDAYETLNKFHVTLENNQCTYTEDADVFTVEIVKSATDRMKLQTKFGDSDDDICLFLTRVGVTAQGSLLTILKGSKNEFQPGVALSFKGEATTQSMYENLTEEDLANYNKIVQDFSELVNGCTTMVEDFSSKIKTIAAAFKI